MKLLATLTALLCPLFFSVADDKPKLPEPQRAELEKLGGFEPFPSDPESFNLQIEVLMVALPEADALALLPQLKDAAKIEKACATIQEMLIAKRGKLVSWPSVITKSGNRAVFENIDEFRYPIEFTTPAINAAAAGVNLVRPQGPVPPQPEAAVPEPLAPGTVKPSEVDPVAPPKAAAPELPPGAKQPRLLQAVNPQGHAIPTTFETKNVGVTFEVEPSLDTNTMRIVMNLRPQHVFFAGMERNVVESMGTKVTVEQPRFRVNRVETNVTLPSGRPLFLAQFRSPDHADWLELFILRATAVPIK